MFFLHIFYFSRVLFFRSVTHADRPIPTHPPCNVQRFCADPHRFTLNCWVVGGVGWATFSDPPYESDFILVTQARAIICCLLNFDHNIFIMHWYNT